MFLHNGRYYLYSMSAKHAEYNMPRRHYRAARRLPCA